MYNVQDTMKLSSHPRVLTLGDLHLIPAWLKGVGKLMARCG